MIFLFELSLRERFAEILFGYSYRSRKRGDTSAKAVDYLTNQCACRRHKKPEVRIEFSGIGGESDGEKNTGIGVKTRMQ
jgi:hypothetical protein